MPTKRWKTHIVIRNSIQSLLKDSNRIEKCILVIYKTNRNYNILNKYNLKSQYI